ncbi:MAG: radical SAM protein [Deltaproteobacteria bacterium]|nr:radical SAM protein [Deltaproteobacteria bacterium]
MTAQDASPRYAADFAERVVFSVARGRAVGADAEPLRRLAAGLAAAENRRQEAGRRFDITIPHTLVIGATSRCNLHCPSCMVRADRSRPPATLSRPTLARLLAECSELGIGRVAFVGGEPLLLPRLHDLVASHPRTLFVVFTNGRAVDSAFAARWRGTANAAFFVNASAGSSSRPAEAALARLHRAGLPCGFAATVHAKNTETFSDAATYDRLAASGASFALVLDYLPAIGDAADPLLVPPAPRRRVVAAARAAARRHRLLVICAPEDEDALGGCGIAGRSLLHVDPRGAITPCPFVPLSPFRFGPHSLLHALQSSYFRDLREAAPAWDSRPGSCTARKGGADFLALAARHQALESPVCASAPLRLCARLSLPPPSPLCQKFGALSRLWDLRPRHARRGIATDGAAAEPTGGTEGWAGWLRSAKAVKSSSDWTSAPPKWPPSSARPATTASR